MSFRADVQLIAGREITTRLRDRTFRLSTAFSVLVIVAIAVLPGFFRGDTATWEIGAVGRSAQGVAERLAAMAPAERAASVIELAGEDAARVAVEAGDVDVAVLAGGTLLADEGIGAELSSALQQSWSTQRLTDGLDRLGVPADEVSALLDVAPAEVTLLDPPDEERDRRVGFVAVGAILLFM